MTSEEQLEREAAGRRLATIAAATAVVFQLAGSFLEGSVLKDAPPRTPGALLDVPAFIDRHASPLILASVLSAVGYLATAVALDFLYRATKFRRPELPAVARVTAYAGPILLSVGSVVGKVAVAIQASDYVARHTTDYFAAARIGRSGVGFVGPWVAEAGLIALGFAFILISMNAMRAGLLTRFMGILGVIGGVLPVLRFPPVIQIFWLGALAYLFAGRWPGGTPRAWQTGKAEPWPSAQEMRERRERGQGAAGTGQPAPDPPAVRPRAGAAGPRRRKRKRRR